MRGVRIFLPGFLFLPVAIAADLPGQVSLTVPSGAPLRVYLTKKIPKRLGAPVEAKLLEPVYAFDKQVVPAGVVLNGRVSSLDSLTKWHRFLTMLNGDFTPLHQAKVEFTTMVMPDGRIVRISTVGALPLTSIYIPPKPSKKPKKVKPAAAQPQNQKTGTVATAEQKAKEQVKAQIDSKTRSVAAMVHAPDKKEQIIDYAMSRLPYHPQSVRRGTRIDAELAKPLEFGAEDVTPAALAVLGSQPAADSVAHARLLTALDSATAKKGDPVVAVLAEPVFSPDHKLILPEGTRVTGSVVLVKRARLLHRGGQLRFTFQKFELPADVAALRPGAPEPAPVSTQAILSAAERAGKTDIKVDSEGGVKATESKTRLLAPLIAVMVANKAADTDVGRHAPIGATNGNVGGRTLGGMSGFGLAGSAAAQSSKYAGMALGFYGMAWSVYSSVIARGGEVSFNRNAVIDVKFGARRPPQASKYVAAAGSK
jgi:hypothetical protein